MTRGIIFRWTLLFGEAKRDRQTGAHEALYLAVQPPLAHSDIDVPKTRPLPKLAGIIHSASPIASTW